MEAHPRISVCSSCTPDWTLEQDLKLYTELGVTTVNPAIQKMDRCPGRDANITLLRESGLGVDAVIPGNFPNLRAQETWKATQVLLLDSIATGAEVGARYLLITGGSGHGLHFEEAARLSEEFHVPVREAAESCGLRLALEPVRPRFAKLGFVHTLRDAEGFADRLGADLLLDTTHIWWEPDLLTSLQRCAQRVATVQVADLRFDDSFDDRAVPEDGELQLGDVLSALEEGGYRGKIDLELTGPVVEAGKGPEAVRRSVEWLTNLCVSEGW